MLAKIRDSFPSSESISTLPKTIAKEILDFVFYEVDDVGTDLIYPLKKEIIQILKNQKLLDTYQLLEYIPTLYGNWMMSCGRLDCTDIYKFIITNLITHNQISIENIRSKITKIINQEESTIVRDSYKYFLSLLNQELNL